MDDALLENLRAGRITPEKTYHKGQDRKAFGGFLRESSGSDFD